MLSNTLGKAQKTVAIHFPISLLDYKWQQFIHDFISIMLLHQQF
jgi:hypothetical protein